MRQALAVGLGLVPVVLFLVGLMVLDSFKLVTRSTVIRAIAWGGVAALLSLGLNTVVLEGVRLDPVLVKRYVAPLIEELLKAVYVVVLIRGGRVGFLVDAAILGFAAGTGFALVENIYYAWTLGDFRPLLWIVRGLGTAVLHGSTTAVVAIAAKDLTDRRNATSLRLFAPGLGLAWLVHSFFNHLVLNPLLSTALLLLAMPLLLFLVFEHSERATRDWLGAGFDNDLELLETIQSGAIKRTRVGEYFESLRDRLPGPVRADMLCWLEIYLELALRAKGLLIARSAGIRMPPDEEVTARFVELRYLERSIGPTGRLALTPLMRTSRRDLWQLYFLAGDQTA
jgi:RsiW-degrading membrane proteinase PrsW (M82 family)